MGGFDMGPDPDMNIDPDMDPTPDMGAPDVGIVGMVNLRWGRIRWTGAQTGSGHITPPAQNSQRTT